MTRNMAGPPSPPIEASVATFCADQLYAQFTKQLLARGHHVFATARSPKQATELHNLQQGGAQLTLDELDTTAPESIQAWVDTVKGQTSQLQVGSLIPEGLHLVVAKVCISRPASCMVPGNFQRSWCCLLARSGRGRLRGAPALVRYKCSWAFASRATPPESSPAWQGLVHHQHDQQGTVALQLVPFAH